VKFFIDNCISVRLAKMLRALGAETLHLTEMVGLDPDGSTPDIYWMPVVAKDGYIAVTSDARIRSRPAERKLRKELKLGTVFLPTNFASSGLWEQAAKLVKWWPTIAEQVGGLSSGDCLLVSQHGKCEQLRNP
jgi:hypothetical protein